MHMFIVLFTIKFKVSLDKSKFFIAVIITTIIILILIIILIMVETNNINVNININDNGRDIVNISKSIRSSYKYCFPYLFIS